jgi:hypothetical protein
LGLTYGADRTVPGRGDERAYSVARIIGFTGEHFAEHLGELAAIKDNHGL